MYKEQHQFFFKMVKKIFSSLVLMFLVQSCGSSDDSFTEALTEREAELADSLPFAFDVDIDHIGYMNCESSDNLTISNTYFNFIAGAFNQNSGVKFRENFFSSIGDIGANRERLSEYLAASRRNADTGVVMSIRTAGDFRVPFGDESEDPVNFVSPVLWDPGSLTLTTTEVSTLLYDNPSGVNYISGLPGTFNKTLDSTLSFNGIGTQEQIRSALQDDSYLSFTFATSDLESPGVAARSPFDEAGLAEGARQSVFGKGYRPSFSKYDSTRNSSPNDVLAGVDGFDLENNAASNGETWVCPSNERYIIVRPEDARRRFDDAPDTRTEGGVSVDNNPWDENYNDGGQGVGGYYMDYLDEDPDDSSAQIRVRHKVICPTLPDNMAANQSEHSDQAWKRVRSLLSVRDWYVFRGGDGRYNCIVPKQDQNGEACYGDFLSVSDTEDPNSNNNREIRYFADEDSVDKRIADNEIVEDTGSARRAYPPIRDCESSSGSGSTKFCPKIFSVCYKQ